MSTPLALITADWHIRKNDQIWLRHPEIRGDVSYGIHQMCQLAEQYRVKYVLIAGDIFEERLQQSDTVQMLRTVLDFLSTRRIQVMFIQGQHELSYPTWMCALHGWPTYIHERLVQLNNGPLIYGLDYCQPSGLPRAFSGIPANTDLLLTHQLWQEFMGSHGSAHTSMLPKPEMLVYSGDLHQHVQAVCANGTKLWSPGPLCPQDLSEFNQMGVYILNDDLTHQSVSLQRRRAFTVTIGDEAELETFIADWQNHPARPLQSNVPPSIEMSILRVKYPNNIPQIIARLRKTVGHDVYLFEDPHPAVKTEITIDRAERIDVVQGGGLPRCIERYYGDNPEVRRDAVKLYRSTEIVRDIEQIFSEAVKATNDNSIN